MLNFKIQIHESCKKHPGYSPEKDGEAGIKGNCEACSLLLDLYDRATLAKSDLLNRELVIRILRRGGLEK
jgi:hypothetical protein